MSEEQLMICYSLLKMAQDRVREAEKFITLFNKKGNVEPHSIIVDKVFDDEELTYDMIVEFFKEIEE